jgi:hypothetical protein
MDEYKKYLGENVLSEDKVVSTADGTYQVLSVALTDGCR